MIRLSVIVLQAFLLLSTTWAAGKPHIIVFGKWVSVSWYRQESGPARDLKVRPLFIDGRQREFTLGLPHDITDRWFTVQRAVRMNDTLPGESPLRWGWEPGGWLLVDRMAGRISSLPLAEFDAAFSQAAWYRDYAAYCGLSEDGRKMYAVVLQWGRRKPLLRESLGEAGAGPELCPAPTWQRGPVRVTFAPAGRSKTTYAVHGRSIDMVSDAEDSAADAAENR
ncbi:MAG: hypothetical protein JST79_05500 [Acidobacteria bacterium]|nr:hypothetical protein [Acidobacteriota bacterium]